MEYVLLLGNRIGVTRLLDRVPDIGIPYPLVGKILLAVIAAHFCFRLLRRAFKRSEPR